MGILDKINRWRGIYDESVPAKQEFASFTVKFGSFEDFAEPFSRSMGVELFKAMGKEGEIVDGVPFVLWGDRPASNEYVYIYHTDVLSEEKLAQLESEQEAFVEGLDRNYKTVIITLVCVDESSEAFEHYCHRKARMEGFDLMELVVGIDFAEKIMHTSILTNCPGERNASVLRKEFLRMIRAAENCFDFSE